MTSEFYLIDKSFRFIEELSKEELEDRIKDLSQDYEYIRQYDSEKIYVHDSIYEEIIYPGISVVEFLSFSPSTKKVFNKQLITYLNIIIRKSTRTHITTDEVVEILLNEQSETTVHGLICLHEVEDIDNNYLVYNRNNWIDFHRYYLAEYPKTPDFFVSECSKYFPQLFLHKDNVTTIRKILHSSSKTIVHYLTELNDKLPLCKTITSNRFELLNHFNSMCTFDIPSSIEGKLERKDKLTFYFTNDIGIEEHVYCDPHLKLLYNDLKKKEQNRIYFHEGKQNIEGGKILIGHIGAHINFK